ncbi:MAG: hypothetical protein J1E84_05880 [Muribaculaceae bacterium]|nr:hypothetical protein [Muribaculaceae bacterium]
MKKLIFILIVAVAMSGANLYAQKNAKTSVKTAQATDLPAGFDIKTLVNVDNNCDWYPNLADKLKEVGFTLITQGYMTETSSRDGSVTGKTTTYTYGCQGIKIKFTQAGRIEELSFPNKATFDRFIATAIEAGYKVENDDLWDFFYKSPCQNACFSSDGLNIWFQAAI